jgi:phospholipid N-methyltransferase
MGFLKEGLRNIKTVGTLTRSSNFLCKEMIRHVDFAKADVIIELGAGDGVITRHILGNMHPDAKLFAFEVNSEFCKKLRGINDPRLIVIEESAEHLHRHLEEHGIEKVDGILSAIPFVVIPPDVTNGILDNCKRVLKNGGKFIQVHYSLIKKKMYEKAFGNVSVDFVPLNLPPAFVLVSVMGLKPAT